VKTRLLFALALWLGLWVLPTHGHVGSDGVVYEGTAGPYRVLVSIQPPDVIPGTARVSVMVEGTGVQRVRLKPIYFRSGDEGSPESDPAEPVPGEPNRYTGEVWLMDAGTASVSVEVVGSQGTGTALVPVMAVSTALRPMEPWRGWVLGAMGLLLVVLLATLFGAAFGDSRAVPGEEVSQPLRRRRLVGAGIGLLVGSLMLFGGSAWWSSWASDYRRFMYRPYTATSAVRVENGERVLTMHIDTASVRNRTLSHLIPDHGKLMHLFLVRQGTLDAFAHVHPARVDSATFQVTLPNLPAGTYLAYADVVRYQGFTYTIADTVQIPTVPSTEPRTPNSPHRIQKDPEDTYVVTNPLDAKKPLVTDAAITLCGTPGVKTKLPDGATIVWEGKPGQTLKAGEIVPLSFAVENPDGTPAQLQTYLGMMGHAAVVKDDGSVYIHLHPTGTYSAASRQVLETRVAQDARQPVVPPAKAFRDSIDRVVATYRTLSDAEREARLMREMGHAAGDSTHVGHARVSFPYAFPRPGRYRIWVQVKREGRIQTGAFEAEVGE
jgi:hypothetical protein